MAAKVALALKPLVELLGRKAPLFEKREVEPALLRARLADAYRDVGVAPTPPERFDALTAPLSQEDWRRLALLVSALELDELKRALPALLGKHPAASQVADAFVGFAERARLLTPELIRKSPMRAEELARGFLAALGAGVAGETETESKEALSRLDYKRLLAEAERAKAEAREHLKKLQEAEDKRRAPRGKW
jgi:hypothetical protein